MWLQRKDRYNKKLLKYLVTYEEGDEELSEDEERHVREDEEAPSLIKSVFLHVMMFALDPFNQSYWIRYSQNTQPHDCRMSWW